MVVVGNGERGLGARGGWRGTGRRGAGCLRRGWDGTGGEEFAGGEGWVGLGGWSDFDREGAEGLAGVDGIGLEDAVALGVAGAGAVARAALGTGTLLLAGEPVRRLDAGAGERKGSGEQQRNGAEPEVPNFARERQHPTHYIELDECIITFASISLW